MIKIIAFAALTIYGVSAGAVELLSAAQLAPIPPAIVTSRSSQYFSQNHNALATPVVAPAPVAQYVAPAATQVTQYAAPFAQYVAPAVAPIARYISPVAASYSQVTRYAAPFAQYVAISAPLLQANLAAANAAPLITGAAPLVTGASPLLASPAVLAKAPLAVASAQPVPLPQRPLENPSVQSQNSDDESIEIETARVRNLPQARSQHQQNLAGAQQGGPIARFQPFPQQNVAAAQLYQEQGYQQNIPGSQQGSLVARFQRFPEQNLAATQQGLQPNAQNARLSVGPPAQARNQQSQESLEPSARNLIQQQRGSVRNGALAAAPGLLNSQQYIQGPYFR